MSNTMIKNEPIVLQANNIHYSYGKRDNKISILENLDIKIKQNESIAIIGASGTGKSTLLHVLGGLDKPEYGEIILCGKRFSSAKESFSAKEQGYLRNKNLGFVYQFHHLLPEFTALENVMMPLLIRKEKKIVATEIAKDLIDKVGVGNRTNHKPSQLSGGERQRIAIARAMVTNPKCILADEPTGNLDTNTSESVMDILFKLQESKKTALIIVTHDHNIANKMQNCYLLKNKNIIKNDK